MQKRVYYKNENRFISKTFEVDIYYIHENYNNYFSFDYYQQKNIVDDFNHKQYQSNELITNKNELKVFFVVLSKMIFICCRCNEKFSFNNKLYYHI